MWKCRLFFTVLEKLWPSFVSHAYYLWHTCENILCGKLQCPIHSNRVTHYKTGRTESMWGNKLPAVLWSVYSRFTIPAFSKCFPNIPLNDINHTWKKNTKTSEDYFIYLFKFVFTFKTTYRRESTTCTKLSGIKCI